MSGRMWLGLAAGVVVLAGIVGVGMWYMQGMAMYRLGGARRDLQRVPAATGADAPGFWRVTPTVSLRHFEAGSGTDVLVVHGGPGFPPLRPWAAADYTGQRVHWIFYQQRGCGESTRPFDRPPPGSMYRQMQAVEGTLGLGAQVADIERIRQHLGRDKLVLLGHSFGALIAALYAAEFPEHVQALALVAPANLVVMPNEGADLYRLIGDRLPQDMRAEYAAYVERMFDFRGLFREDERALGKMFLDFQRFYGVAATASGGAMRPASAVPAAGVGGAASDSAAAGVPGEGDVPAAAGFSGPGAGTGGIPGGTSGAAGEGVSGPGPGPGPGYGSPAGGWVTVGLYLSLGRRHDWRDALQRVRAPVLVLHGTRDLQPEAQSRQFASFFPHARFELIPDAGHFSFDERPREFAAALEAFLAERS